MWSTFAVLLLWAADKNLLSKIWAFLASTGKQTAWSALTLYSNWKSTNDMIRDGYHVDEVYLYEYPGSVTQDTTAEATFREIDVLRIFRQHIQLQTFTHAKSIGLVQFIELCCDPMSNFTEYDRKARYELVVSYTFDHNHYKIVYGTGQADKVRFPIYTEKTIRTKDIKKTGVLTAAMLTAEADAQEGIDVYAQLKQLAGPMENFYTDTEYTIRKSHLHYTGLRVPAESMFIKMLDLWGTEFVVRPEQQFIKLEK